MYNLYKTIHIRLCQKKKKKKFSLFYDKNIRFLFILTNNFSKHSISNNHVPYFI